MKYALTLVFALLAVSFAAPAIYVDDRGFDYSEEVLSSFVFDGETDQYMNIPMYVHFESPTVDGALRIHFSTEDNFHTDIPVLLVNVPKASDELNDLVELDFQGNNANSPNALTIEITDLTLVEAIEGYVTKFQELNYDVAQLDSTTYTIEQLNSSYQVSFVEDGGSVKVSISGI